VYILCPSIVRNNSIIQTPTPFVRRLICNMQKYHRKPFHDALGFDVQNEKEDWCPILNHCL
jgi:hypothetical protein